jgi:uncharacterized protein
VTEVSDRLRAALQAAIRARDPVAGSALRSALAARSNAEAVAAPARVTPPSEHVAGAMVGLGAGEVPRRQLTAAEVDDIVAAEVSDREAAAADFDRRGAAERAGRLRAEAAVLAGLRTGDGGSR